MRVYDFGGATLLTFHYAGRPLPMLSGRRRRAVGWEVARAVAAGVLRRARRAGVVRVVWCSWWAS